MILKILKRAGQLILIPIITGTVVLVLMAAAFLLPVGEIRAHVQNSLQIFDREGLYFNLTGEQGELHDSFVETQYLNQAIVSAGDADLLHCVMSGYSFVYRNQSNTLENLRTALEEPEKVQPADSELRFMNGQVVYLKPLLRITDYAGVRTLCLYSCTLGTILLGYLMYRRKLGKFILPVMLSVLFICPLAVWMSMAFSGIYMCMLIPCLVMLAVKKETLRKRAWLLFGLTGSVTFCINMNYFQLISFGVPLLMYLLITGMPEKPAEMLKAVLDFFIAWMIGYAGAMVFKWAAYSVLMGRNIFGDMIDHALWRSGEEEGSRLATIWKNTTVGFGNPWWALAEAAFILCTLAGWKKHRTKVSFSFAEILLMIAMILLPAGRYAILANHSMLHSYFVYRILMIPVLAFNLLLAGRDAGEGSPGRIAN